MTTPSRSAQPATDTDSLRAWIRPVSTAFADDYTDAMFDIDTQLWEKDRLIGAKDGDRWVGGASAFSMRLTVPGGMVRAAGSERCRRRAHASAARDPDRDDALAARPGRGAGRAGVDPACVGGRDLPALRVRAGDAPGNVRGRSERVRLPGCRGAGRARADRRGRRGDAARAARVRGRRRLAGGRGEPDARQVAPPAAGRRPVAAEYRDQVHGSARGRRRDARLRDLPRQERVGRPRAQERADRHGGDRPGRRRRTCAVGMAGRHGPHPHRSPPGANPCRRRCSSSCRIRAGSG